MATFAPILAVEAAFGAPAGTVVESNPMILWYDEPAAKWVEALPIGNGRLGAMVFGGTENERIQFNEDTLWNGEPHDYSHEGAADYLPTIRRLLFEGKQREAEELAMKHFMSAPPQQKAYQPFGDLLLHFPGHGEAEQCRRELDIDSAIPRVSCRVSGVTFRRKVFASAPDEVIAVRITADKPGQVAFTANLTSPHPNSQTRAVENGQIALTGGVQGGAIKFEARLLVSFDGGEGKISHDSIEVKNADAATLLLTGATNYVSFRDVSGNPAKRCEDVISAVRGKTFDALCDVHVADHQRLFRRVSLNLGVTEKAKLTTDERIKSFAEGDDPQLAALYFQFGRYLMIASSRPGSQPANLQGIWNESTAPPLDSKWTVNINTEMNYWPAEPCNLAECHEPLFDMLAEVMVSGRKTAKAHYNCRGWVLHHSTDLWRGTAPINHSNHGVWSTGGRGSASIYGSITSTAAIDNSSPNGRIQS